MLRAEPVAVHDEVVGHEDVVDHHGVRPRGAQADRVVSAPVVDHRALLHRDDGREHGHAAVRERAHRGRDEVRAVRGPGGVRPAPADAIAPLDLRRRALRRGAVRRREVAVAMGEQLVLRLLSEVGADLEHVRGAQAEVPARPEVPLGDGHRHAQERLEVEPVAAVAARLQDAEEAGLHERAMQLGGVAAGRLGRLGLGTDAVAQRTGPRDDLVGGEVRLGDRDLLHGQHGCSLDPPGGRRRTPGARSWTVSARCARRWARTRTPRGRRG